MILNFNSKSPEIQHLSTKDLKLSKIINWVGDVELHINNDYYSNLINSIIGQQLSAKAKRTIQNNFTSLFDDLTPINILNTDDEIIRSAGLSYKKISYIKDLSHKIINNKISLDSLPYLTETEIINELTSVKGIGTWTAEMFLIFSLGKLDIFSFKDAGLIRSLKWLYNIEDNTTDYIINNIVQVWTPYKSIASLYLWQVIDTGLINKSPNEI